ncbi:MAG: ATP-binding protein [Bradyrhizobium sp.]|nr:ATP-binding protein [Bradyrhizobium sp.]
MRLLLELGFRRLAGKGDQPSFVLSQAMGGGKTHMMVALGLLARLPTLRRRILAEAGLGDELEGVARVAAVTGRRNPPHYLWGEIAAQLGKAEAFRRFWADGPRAPDEDDWKDLLGNEPTLIMFDELPSWFDYAVVHQVGGGTLANVARYALANLFEAARKTNGRTCIVASNLSGGAYPDAVRDLEREAFRGARPIEPVSLQGGDIFAILRKRLFQRLPSSQAIDEVADAYVKAMEEAVKARAVQKSPERLAEEIHGCYPFHPRFADLVATFRNNENFRQTRGLLGLAGRIVRGVWERKTNDVHLVGIQHANLADGSLRSEPFLEPMREAIAHDIANQGQAKAEAIDVAQGSDAGSQVAVALIFASIGSGPDSKRGLTRSELVECLMAPNRTATEFGIAFDALRGMEGAWYLHGDGKEEGAYRFTNQENLTRRLQKEAKDAPESRIHRELVDRLEKIFEPQAGVAYQRVLALPEMDAIDLRRDRTLLVMSPDSGSPPKAAATLFSGIVEKNNLLIVTGDETRFASMDSAARRLYAARKVWRELGRDHPQAEEVQEKLEQAEFDLLTTIEQVFNKIWYPAISPRTRQPDLLDQKLDLRVERPRDAPPRLVGEPQIEEALGPGKASKLIPEPEKQAPALLDRIEEQLWPGGVKKARWTDIETNARSMARFAWLPGKGLDTLKRVAIQQARWRETADGFIERGPFEKAKTTVSISLIARDPNTGEARLEVKGFDAGTRPVIRCSNDGPATPSSPELKELSFSTTKLHLWFLAEDSTGEHPTGDPVPWRNTITILHEPRDTSAGRVVELKAVPAGSLRWTVGGTSPRDMGNPYVGPVTIPTLGGLLRVLAEEGDISVENSFEFGPLRNGMREKPQTLSELVDPARPASLIKRIERTDTQTSFELINHMKETHASALGAVLTVGLGDTSSMLRIGRDAPVQGAAIERAAVFLRELLNDERAAVALRLDGLAFLTGADMLVLVDATHEPVDPSTMLKQ